MGQSRHCRHRRRSVSLSSIEPYEKTIIYKKATNISTTTTNTTSSSITTTLLGPTTSALSNWIFKEDLLPLVYRVVKEVQDIHYSSNNAKQNGKRRRSLSCGNIRVASTSSSNNSSSIWPWAIKSIVLQPKSTLSYLTSSLKFHHAMLSSSIISSEQKLEEKQKSQQPVYYYCAYCNSHKASHDTASHICSVCNAIGRHSSSNCLQRLSDTTRSSSSHNDLPTSSNNNTRLSSISEHVEKILTLTTNSLDESSGGGLVRKGLTRLGLFQGAAGSQTPITTPHSNSFYDEEEDCDNSIIPTHNYVLSYVEGQSVVTESIYKVMQMIMHHVNIPTRAFKVEVSYDVEFWNKSDDDNGDLYLTGMSTPVSFAPTPVTRCKQAHKNNTATLDLLVRARQKIIYLCHQQLKKKNH